MVGERWASSGLMWLTGWSDRPALPRPAGVADALASITDDIAELTNGRVVLDGPALAAERAAIRGLTRGGRVSPGGACRLVETADGWIAVNLPRQSDVELVPAWLESTEDDWQSVVRTRPTRELVERAALLGLPVAVPGECTSSPVVRRPRGSAATSAPRRIDGARVVDLSALWAGPLCASVLSMAGADVIKVEDPARPDGARSGPPEFFDLLHAGHRSVVLPLDAPELRALLATADVVIESARPRAFEQLGIDREQTNAVWVAITGHGLDTPGRNRPAFGDDAAVAGGLVATDPDDGGPLFVADALADPGTALLAAKLTLEALNAGGPWILDTSLAACASELRRMFRTTYGTSAKEAEEPRARAPRGNAAPMGAYTAEVLAEVGGRAA
jgi:hypothetical protein